MAEFITDAYPINHLTATHLQDNPEYILQEGWQCMVYKRKNKWILISGPLKPANELPKKIKHKKERIDARQKRVYDKPREAFAYLHYLLHGRTPKPRHKRNHPDETPAFYISAKIYPLESIINELK